MKYSTYFLLLLSLAGCIPAHTNYYKPTANIRAAINGSCGTVIAPKSTYKVVIEGVGFRVTGHDSYLIMYLRIPEGTNVEIESEVIDLIYADKNHQGEMSNFTYYDRKLNESISLSAGNIFKGSNERFALENVESRIFSSVVKFGVPMKNIYKVQFPSLKINGKRHSIPIINFKKESGFGIYPINC